MAMETATAVFEPITADLGTIVRNAARRFGKKPAVVTGVGRSATRSSTNSAIGSRPGSTISGSNPAIGFRSTHRTAGNGSWRITRRFG
jgi:hypothetical protein